MPAPGEFPAAELYPAAPLPPPRLRVRRIPVEPATDPQARSAAASVPPAAALPKARDYEVGYGKPPKSGQFKPGQSGNPKGRPKGAKGMNTIVREIMTEKVSVRRPDGSTTKLSRAEVLMQKTVEAAVKGNFKAADLLVKMYRLAVPDAAPEPDLAASLGGEELTATDIASLAHLLASLADAAGPA